MACKAPEKIQSIIGVLRCLKRTFWHFRLYNITMGPIVKVSKDPSGTLDSLWDVQTLLIGLEYVLLGVAVSPIPHTESLALFVIFWNVKLFGLFRLLKRYKAYMEFLGTLN